jgi:HlyD family secretion protein
MTNNKNNKLLRFIGIITGVLITAVIIGKSTGMFSRNDATMVMCEDTELRDIIQTVSANGKIQPEVEVKISSDVSGEIIELYVKEGDSVKAGQLLAIIDPEIYKSVAERGEAAVNNSKAGLANNRARLYQVEVRLNEMESQLSRNKKLYDQKFISDAEYEAVLSAHAAAKADYESTKQSIIAAEYTVKTQEAGLKEAQQNLIRTRILSPVDGIVSKLNVERGERVVGTMQMTGTEMMRIANLNDMEVSVDVNENDIIRVSLGDSADIEVDAYTNRIFKGLVTQVANSATMGAQTGNDQVTNFVVKVRILRSSYEDLTAQSLAGKSVFRPGMSASVDIRTELAMQAISIPIEAVTIKEASTFTQKEDVSNGMDAKTYEAVFVFTDGIAKLVKVKTGIQNDRYIQILEGLVEKQTVITGPYSAVSRILKDGSTVQQTSKERLFKPTK